MHGEAIRMSLLDPTHILCSFRPNGKIDRIRNMLPKPIPPVNYLKYNGPRPVPPRETPLDKEAETQRHVERRTASLDTDIWAYSDGSMNNSRNTGAGWAVYQGSTLLSEGRKNCGKWMEVADAEAEAALEAVKAACEHATPGTTSLWLCIDNRSVVDGINATSDKIGTSQPTIDEIRGKLSGWQHQGNGQAMWVPGHTSVQGNERADRLAKEGAGLEQACDTRWMTLARAKRWRKEWLAYRLDNWWNQQRKPGHLKKQLEVPKPWNHKLYRGLNRVNVGRVLAARRFCRLP
jgi:ribonuclease HI